MHDHVRRHTDSRVQGAIWHSSCPRRRAACLPPAGLGKAGQRQAVGIYSRVVAVAHSVAAFAKVAAFAASICKGAI